MKKFTKTFIVALLMLFGFSQKALSQTVTANFSFTPSQACQGTPVVFTDLSTVTSGSISVWSYEVTGATSTSYSNQNPLITFTLTGVQTITLGVISYTNSNPLYAQTIKTINVLPSPTISASSGYICSGQSSFTIVPNGANTYTFSGGSDVVSPTVTTSYTVTGTTINGCTATAISNVTVNPLILPTITVNSGSICAGNWFKFVPSGAVTYTFSDGTSSFTTSVVNPTANTTYSVIGTNNKGCTSTVSAISDVTVNALPLPTVTVSDGTICLGKSFTISPSGANTYTYENTSATFSSAVVSPTINSTYTVTGTDGTGCNGSATLNVNVNANPTINIVSSQTTALCPGSTVTLTAGGGTSYVWVAPLTSTIATAEISPTIASTYTVEGTDANGCTSKSTYTQTLVPNPINITTTKNLLCINQTATLTASGGNSYTWAAPLSSVIAAVVISPTVETTYTVTATSSVCPSNTWTAVFTQSVSSCIGIQELSNQNIYFSVYPNPTDGVISYELGVMNEGQIHILNALGQVMLTQTMNSEQGTRNKKYETINLEHLPTGIYFVKVISNNNVIATKKIIKE